MSIGRDKRFRCKPPGCAAIAMISDAVQLTTGSVYGQYSKVYSPPAGLLNRKLILPNSIRRFELTFDSEQRHSSVSS